MYQRKTQTQKEKLVCLEGHTGTYPHVEAGKDFSLRDCEQVFALLTHRVRFITQSVVSSPGFHFPAWNVGVIAGFERVPLVPGHYSVRTEGLNSWGALPPGEGPTAIYLVALRGPESE